MTIDELRVLSRNGVVLQVKAEDLLELVQSMKTTSASESVYLTLNEAAKYYRKSRQTIVRYLESGILRGKKLGQSWYIEGGLSYEA